MAEDTIEPIRKMVTELSHLPGIGAKSAQRIAYHILTADAEEARRLAQAIIDVKEQVHFCSECFNYATRERCDVCEDPSRDQTSICVVSEPRAVSAIERTGAYHGLYHVLGGVISPMDKIGPEQLRVRELLERLADAPRPYDVDTVLLYEDGADVTALSRAAREIAASGRSVTAPTPPCSGMPAFSVPSALKSSGMNRRSAVRPQSSFIERPVAER